MKWSDCYQYLVSSYSLHGVGLDVCRHHILRIEPSLSLPLNSVVVGLGKQMHLPVYGNLWPRVTDGSFGERLNEWLFRGPSVAGAELFWHCCFSTVLLKLHLEHVAGHLGDCTAITHAAFLRSASNEVLVTVCGTNNSLEASFLSLSFSI